MTTNTQSHYHAIEVISDETDLDVVTGGGIAYDGVMHAVRGFLFNYAMDAYVIGEMYRENPCHPY
jgi:hypothetical protein